MFGPSAVQATFALEERNFESWKKTHETDMAESTARKRWHMIAKNVGMREAWSNGQDYVRLWQEGIRPTYSPALTEPDLLLAVTPDALVSASSVRAIPVGAKPAKATSREAKPAEMKPPPSGEKLLAKADFMGVVRRPGRTLP